MQPANDEMRAVGAGLADLCDTKGISYRELGRRAGLAPGTVSNMMGGKSFELINLFKALKALDKKPGDFFMDLGFTDELDEYTYTVLKITVRSRGFRRAFGQVEKVSDNAKE